MNKYYLLFILCSFVTLAYTEESDTNSCISSKPKTYWYGTISRSQCGTTETGYKESIYHNGNIVLTDTQLFDDDSNRDRSIRIYTSGSSNTETGCARRLFLIDFSTQPVKAIAFGVKNACNVFHWASWGKKRSVIALKRNVKFIYENGKIKPPELGENLWNSIEPPHAGEGLSMKDAIPFAEELVLPK